MNIVITGSTKGIGLGMAHEYVRLGHNVVVSSRRAAAVDDAVKKLNSLNAGKATGIAADVAAIADVRALWEHAANTFGTVDIWINNAGVSNRKLNLDQIPDEQLVMVSQTNLLGMMNCCKVALVGMLKQDSGKIFNMEGFGSEGLVKQGMSVYGATKCAVLYLTKSMIKEYKDTPLIIGLMSPGIVVTDLLMKDLNDSESEEFKSRSGMFNIVADRVETVAPYLVKETLAANKSGTRINSMTIWKVLGRFIQSPFVKRDVLSSANSNSEGA